MDSDLFDLWRGGGDSGRILPGIAFLSPAMSYISLPMKKLIPILCAALVLTVFAAPARAEETVKKGFPPSVTKAEIYFDNLKTAKARFLQTSPDGKQLAGTFYLSRPGKLRFEYDSPVRDFIVADGTFIYFYDAQLGEQSNAPIGQTLADFLLRPNIRLRDDLRVTGVVRGGGLTQISVVQTSDPAAGKIILGFTDEPFELKKWRVVDSTGAVTEVELFDLEKDIKIDSKMFVYRAPKGATRYN
jgi:outer membrane lipoprotein-sorting protein